MELPWAHARCREAARSERALLEAVGAVTAESRDSAETLLQALAAALTALEPAVDAVLVFRPDGEELSCTFAAGGRAEYFRGLRLRIGDGSLPSEAILCGHHVALAAQKPVIPTDRAAIAIPMYAGSMLCAIVYAAGCRRAVVARGAKRR